MLRTPGHSVAACAGIRLHSACRTCWGVWNETSPDFETWGEALPWQGDPTPSLGVFDPCPLQPPALPLIE
jgi:hypothetical protein